MRFSTENNLLIRARSVCKNIVVPQTTVILFAVDKYFIVSIQYSISATLWPMEYLQFNCFKIVKYFWTNNWHNFDVFSIHEFIAFSTVFKCSVFQLFTSQNRTITWWNFPPNLLQLSDCVVNFVDYTTGKYHQCIHLINTATNYHINDSEIFKQSSFRNTKNTPIILLSIFSQCLLHFEQAKREYPWRSN